jgi:hypothetical protein
MKHSGRVVAPSLSLFTTLLQSMWHSFQSTSLSGQNLQMLISASTYISAPASSATS